MTLLAPIARLPRRTQYGFAVLVGVALLIVWLRMSADNVPGEQMALASLVIGVSVAPLVIYLFSGPASLLPLMPLNCLFYVTAIAISGFYVMPEVGHAQGVAPAHVQTGLQIVILGVASQIAAYYLTHAAGGPGRPVPIVADLSVRELRTMAWLGALVRGLSLAIPATLTLPSLGQFADLCSWTSIAMLYALHLQKRLTFAEQVILFGLVFPMEAAIRLNTGLLANLMLFMLLIALVRWIVVRRVAWVTIGLLALIVVAFSPVKREYRNQVWWNPQGANMSVLEKSELMVRLAGEYWLDPDAAERADVGENILGRLDQLTILGIDVVATPESVPYWGGESFKDGLYVFIPRILWPDKPTMTIGNAFGHRYDILDPGDETTSWNLPWIIEFYANFGLLGVVAGMALVGVALALLERRFGHPDNTKIDAVVAMAITFGLIYPESNLAMMWGGLFMSTVAIYALSRFVHSMRL